MKLKLDLHPIFSDSLRIEQALREIIDQAVEKRATEVEIIPGKGSGALKKTVLRFLDRPEIKARYHRIDKDSDNWGRLFVYFRHDRAEPAAARAAPSAQTVGASCACCGDAIGIPEPDEEAAKPVGTECPWCGSPNRITFWRDRSGAWGGRAELDYRGEST
ncbi:MAG TPA: Smr/MutS family protein [Chthonomonadaceae bacterium]|nr:Smr/MutS family protein [Chthonomonadaceae bacterium]